MKLRLLVCSVLAFSSLGIAYAGPITWDVSGTFDYGGTISGSFTYDADTNVYSAIDLVTTAYYAARDPFVAMLRLEDFKTGAVLTGQQILSDRDLESTETYQDLMRSRGWHHGLFPLIHVNGRRTDSLAFLRAKQQGPFQPNEVDLVQVLLPHLRRAAALSQEFHALRRQNLAVAGHLDRLPRGFALVGSNGRVLVANRAAERALNQADGLCSGPNGLSTSLAAETDKLHSLIRSASRTGLGTGNNAGGEMFVSRPSGAPSYRLIISPHRSPDLFAPGSPAPCVAVIISDPKTRKQINRAALAGLFGLTPMECRLIDLLVQGRSILQISESLRITQHTARSHLKNTFRKTATSRQSELVLLIAQAGLWANE
jgi:DNA-binding CsgD family transcriptional regulator